MERTTHDDGVVVLRLDEGHANAIGPTFLKALNDALDALADDDDARALVLTGTARVFSAGLMLTEVIDFDRDAMGAFMRDFSTTMERVFADTDKIIIDSAAGSGVVPYLPLDRVNERRASGNANTNTQGNR